MRKSIASIIVVLSILGPVKEAQGVTFLELMILIGARDAFINGGKGIVEGLSNGTLLKRALLMWERRQFRKKIEKESAEKSLFETFLPPHARNDVSFGLSNIVEFLEQDPRVTEAREVYKGTRRVYPPESADILARNTEEQRKFDEDTSKSKPAQPVRYLENIDQRGLQPQDTRVHCDLTFITELSTFRIQTFETKKDCDDYCADILRKIRRRDAVFERKGADKNTLSLERFEMLLNYQIPKSTGKQGNFKHFVLDEITKWLESGVFKYAEMGRKKIGIFCDAYLFELENDALTEDPSPLSIIDEHLAALETDEGASASGSPLTPGVGVADVDINVGEADGMQHHVHMRGAVTREDRYRGSASHSAGSPQRSRTSRVSRDPMGALRGAVLRRTGSFGPHNERREQEELGQEMQDMSGRSSRPVSARPRTPGDTSERREPPPLARADEEDSGDFVSARRSS